MEKNTTGLENESVPIVPLTVLPDIPPPEDINIIDGIPEAPNDGAWYARTLQSWKRIAAPPWATGRDWVVHSNAFNNYWQSITYGNNLFVAVGSQSFPNTGIITSPDGINWTSQQNPITDGYTWQSWVDIAYGNELFVAVGTGNSNNIMTSLDGVVWTQPPIQDATSYEYSSITYGNGIFVALAGVETNDGVAISLDGIDWTMYPSVSKPGSVWRSITYGNGLFVAVASSLYNDGVNYVMTSSDGITWTLRQGADFGHWVSVTYGNGLFVAVSSFNTGNQVMISPDGINWTAQQSASNCKWACVTYGNGLFVAVSVGGLDRMMISPNGINWTAQQCEIGGTYNDWKSIVYGNGLFVAVARNGAYNGIMTAP